MKRILDSRYSRTLHPQTVNDIISLRQGGYSKQKKRKLFTAILAVSLMTVGAFLVFFGTNNHLQTPVTTTDAPLQNLANYDESPPQRDASGNLVGYSVGPFDPRFITIPKLQVHARIKTVGLVSGRIDASNSIYETAWYSKSAKPGQAGALFINGHVSGPTKPGVFASLKQLSQQDKIIIERGDGKKFTYSVVSKESLATEKIDMRKALASADTSKPGLTLMTCNGTFNANTQSYQERLIVYAVLE